MMDNAQTNRSAVLPTGSILIKAALAVLFSLTLPLCLSGQFTEELAGFIAVIAGMLGTVDLFLGSASPKYPIICLVLGVIPAFLSQNLFIGACIISVLLTVADGAFAIAFAKSNLRPALVFAIPVLSFTSACLITGCNLIISFTSVMLFPAMFVLSVSIKKKPPRVTAVCAISVSVIIPIIIMAVFAFTNTVGDLTFDSLRDFICDFRESTVKALIESYDAMAATYEETYGQSAAAVLGDGISSEYADTVIAGLINIAPAILIISANIFGFLAHGLTVSRLRRMSATEYLTSEVSGFELSIFAPIVFIVSFAVAYFTSGETGQAGLTVYIAAENIFSVLEPALALFGLKRLFRPKIKFPMFIPFTALLLAALFASAYFIVICAFWGAIARVAEAVASQTRPEN